MDKVRYGIKFTYTHTYTGDGDAITLLARLARQTNCNSIRCGYRPHNQAAEGERCTILNAVEEGASQLVTRSTRHSPKSYDELTGG